mmetsp:Transcript_45083/g.45491  ORF Transcript_45083/g.45491 Transcript_45083/m.45491 type:complete len:89 (-) Transcript_45083:416-682(-)
MGNGNTMYYMPFDAKQVLRLDSSTLRTTLVGNEYQGAWKWSGGAKGKHGIIYDVPFHHKRVLKIVPWRARDLWRRRSPVERGIGRLCF